MPPPRLRPLDVFEVKTENGPAYQIRDHEKIQPNELVVSPFVIAIGLLLDGSREIEEIRTVLDRQMDGKGPSLEQVRQVVDQLDSHFLLQSPAFEARRGEIEKEYLSRQRRPPALFPPAARDELSRLLEGYFTAEGGPGGKPQGEGKRIRGIISPHIDYFRGGPAYAHSYRALVEGSSADLFIILGVAHLSPPSPFVLGDRGYETPFGELPCDSDFVMRLRGRLDWDPGEHRMSERTEHSIELQAIYLRYLIDRPVQIVPILCCSFEPHGPKPAEVEPIDGFIRGLRETILEEKKEVCVISGADLAHVGPRFGDPDPVSPEMIAWMESEDKISLDRVLEGDAEGFYESVTRDGNKRKVCGLSSIYTFLRVLGGGGRLLKYGYAPDPAGGMVSFASVAVDA